jgi:hypothetical protein
MSKLQIGHLARLQLLGVFSTGVLVLTEAWLLLRAGDIREDGVLQVASGQLEGLNSRVLWPATLILLIVAYVVGWLLRQVTVWIMEKSRLPGHHRDWDRLLRIYLGYGSPFPEAALDGLIEVSSGGEPGPGREDEPWSQERALQRLASVLGSPDGREGATRLLVYSKLWLRVRQPLLAVEHIEAEITFLRGLLPPAVLGIAVLVRILLPGPRGPAWAAMAGLALFVITVLVYWLIESLQAVEPLEAARNYLLANAYDREEPAET